MSNPIPPESSTISSPDSSVPAGGTPWRAGPNSRFAGKSAEEIHALAEQQQNALEQQNRLLEQVALRMQHQPQAPVQDFQPQGNPSDFVDLATTEKLVNHRLQQAAAPIGQQMQSLYAMQAQNSLSMIKEKNTELFRKYGGEIMGELASVPHHLWTLDGLNKVVNMVRGNHWQEVADERAREMVANQDPALRPSGGAGGYPQYQQTQKITESDALPAEYRALLQAKGVTDDAVREFCRATGQSVEQWMDLAKRTRTDVITERSSRRDGISAQQTGQTPPR